MLTKLTISAKLLNSKGKKLQFDVLFRG